MCYYDSCWIDFIGIISSTLTAFIYSFFFSRIFLPKKECKYIIWKYFAFIYGMYWICRFVPVMYEYKAFFMFIIYIVSLLVLAKGKWYIKVLFSFFTHLFGYLCQLPLSELLFMKYGYSSEVMYSMADTDYFAVLDMIYSHVSSYALTGVMNICNTFYFYTVLMLGNKKNRHWDVWLICVIISLLFITNSLFLFYFVDSNISIAMLVVGPILSVILIIYIISKLSICRKYDESVEENNFLREKEKMQLSYYEMMKDKEDEVRKINHDIKNNLQVMYGLNDEDKRKEMIDKINSNLDKHYLKKYTTHDILNVVLNIKVNEARNKNIDIDVSVKRKLDFMEDIDVSNLITNVLDNAIEAAEKTNDKSINLVIKKKMNYVIIECENSFNGEIKINKKKQLVTTKNGDHGYGTKIIKNVVDKYNGELNYEIRDNNFKLIIMIEMTEK